MNTKKLHRIVGELDKLTHSLQKFGYMEASRAMIPVKSLVLREIDMFETLDCLSYSNTPKIYYSKPDGIHEGKIIEFPRFFRNSQDIDLLQKIAADLDDLRLFDAANEMSAPILLILLQEESTDGDTIGETHRQTDLNQSSDNNVININVSQI